MVSFASVCGSVSFSVVVLFLSVFPSPLCVGGALFVPVSVFLTA